MSNIFTFSQGDDPPDFVGIAEDFSGPGGTLAKVDLTGATGEFLLARLGETGGNPTAVITGPAIPDLDQVTNIGQFSYIWPAVDKPKRLPGRYGVKVIFTWPDGKARGFPTLGLFPVLVTGTILE